MIRFPCTQCGACCRRAGETGLMPSKEDGSCVYLNGENQCDIYEDRPEHCSVKSMFTKKKKQESIPKDISYKQYCIHSTKICHVMIDSLGLDERYKVDIREYDNA